MYCEKCGKKLSDNASFCRHCGAKIGTEKEEKVEKKEVQSFKKLPPKWVLGFIFLAVLIYPFFSGRFNPSFLAIIYLMPPFVIFIVPYAIISFYFILDRKYRARIDILLIAFMIAMILPGSITGVPSLGYIIFSEQEGQGAPKEAQCASFDLNLDSNVKIFLPNVVPPTSESMQKTLFSSGESIYPQLSGLPKGTKYAFRVVNSTGGTALPIYEYEVKVGGGTEGSGTLNSKEMPLKSGEYKAEIIKIENNSCSIVAQTDFNIA